MLEITNELLASSEFKECGTNLFSAKISDCMFTTEFFPGDNTIFLTMGIPTVSPEAKESLYEMLLESIGMEPISIHIDFHCVSLRMSATDDWASRLNKATQTLTKWAGTLPEKGGCFVCGTTESPIKLCDYPVIRTFLCENCEANYHQDMVQAEKKSTADGMPILLTSSDTKPVLGLIMSFAIGMLTAFPWMFVTVNMTGNWVIVFLVTLLFSYIVFMSYRKFSGGMKRIGVILTTAVVLIILSCSSLLMFSQTVAETFRDLYESIMSRGLDATLNGTQAKIIWEMLGQGEIFANFFPRVGLPALAAALIVAVFQWSKEEF